MKNLFKYPLYLSFLVAPFLFSLLAHSEESSESYSTISFPEVSVNVEVTFSPKLEKYMDQINEKERQAENWHRDQFRYSSKRYSAGGQSPPKWTLEELFPEVSEYTVEKFTVAIVKKSLLMVGLGNDKGTISIHFDKIKLHYHPIKVLNSMQMYATGVMEYRNETGDIIKSKKLTVNYIYDRALSKNRDVDGFYFVESSSDQISPVIVSFLNKGLEKMFDDYNFPGVILVYDGD